MQPVAVPIGCILYFDRNLQVAFKLKDGAYDVAPASSSFSSNDIVGTWNLVPQETLVWPTQSKVIKPCLGRKLATLT